jgi:hypothetical protein
LFWGLGCLWLRRECAPAARVSFKALALRTPLALGLADLFLLCAFRFAGLGLWSMQEIVVASSVSGVIAGLGVVALRGIEAVVVVVKRMWNKEAPG